MINCPRCGTLMDSPLTRNALSRVDNYTYVCSSCGTNEAMYQFANPGRDLPPVDQPITMGGDA